MRRRSHQAANQHKRAENKGEKPLKKKDSKKHGLEKSVESLYWGKGKSAVINNSI